MLAKIKILKGMWVQNIEGDTQKEKNYFMEPMQVCITTFSSKGHHYIRSPCAHPHAPSPPPLRISPLI